VIRPYAPADREAVREIACDTADHGEPVENFFSDRELIADVLTRYYTDVDSWGVWVAESGGRVAGYLFGALDTPAYQKAMARKVIPPAVWGALGRGLLFRCETWRLVRAGLATFFAGGHRRMIPFDLYPAHLHINLRKGERGHGVGHSLMERYLQQLKENGVPGVHAVVDGGNVRMCHFIEAMGFKSISRQPVYFSRKDGLRRGETIVFARKTA
jgi:GNAT superfamily N-acetyltransferase